MNRRSLEILQPLPSALVFIPLDNNATLGKSFPSGAWLNSKVCCATISCLLILTFEPFFIRGRSDESLRSLRRFLSSFFLKHLNTFTFQVTTKVLMSSLHVGCFLRRPLKSPSDVRLPW